MFAITDYIKKPKQKKLQSHIQNKGCDLRLEHYWDE
jgi:hypothetical protein